MINDHFSILRKILFLMTCATSSIVIGNEVKRQSLHYGQGDMFWGERGGVLEYLVIIEPKDNVFSFSIQEGKPIITRNKKNVLTLAGGILMICDGKEYRLGELVIPDSEFNSWIEVEFGENNAQKFMLENLISWTLKNSEASIQLKILEKNQDK